LSSKIKEKVLALVEQLSAPPKLTDMHKPGFVYLLKGNLEGIISYTPSHLEP